ncbi:IclR family transcriptional regulator [Saccharopolyspora hattusasensis]|uniref:IclR family transcriptional regulator n=1 Tax=Saccharopolyspora hattusasensis TaxID=1128679 RepID=UPI003D967BFB
MLHAVDVMQAMSEAGREIGVSDLARKTGMSKATVYNILTTLESRRLVERNPTQPLYRLGWGLYELGAGVARTSDLAQAARHFMDELAEATGETTLLGIYDADSVLHLDRATGGTGTIRIVADTGRRSPLHATASGKVLLAWQPEQTLERVLGGPLRRFTRNTVTDPDQIIKDLETTRQRGYATNWQEYEVGMCSLSVPLRDYTGQVVGALTIAGPAQRISSRSANRLVATMLESARGIEYRLGASVATRNGEGA